MIIKEGRKKMTPGRVNSSLETHSPQREGEGGEGLGRNGISRKGGNTSSALRGCKERLMGKWKIEREKRKSNLGSTEKESAHAINMKEDHALKSRGGCDPIKKRLRQ